VKCTSPPLFDSL
jgi:hypothetical protein